MIQTNQTRIVLPAKRSTAYIFLAVGIFLLLMAFVVRAYSTNRLIGFVAFILFGAFMFIVGIHFFVDRIIIDSNGLCKKTLFSSASVSWSDIDSIRILLLSQPQAMPMRSGVTGIAPMYVVPLKYLVIESKKQIPFRPLADSFSKIAAMAALFPSASPDMKGYLTFIASKLEGVYYLSNLASEGQAQMVGAMSKRKVISEYDEEKLLAALTQYGKKKTTDLGKPIDLQYDTWSAQSKKQGHKNMY